MKLEKECLFCGTKMKFDHRNVRKKTSRQKVSLFDRGCHHKARIWMPGIGTLYFGVYDIVEKYSGHVKKTEYSVQCQACKKKNHIYTHTPLLSKKQMKREYKETEKVATMTFNRGKNLVIESSSYVGDL